MSIKKSIDIKGSDLADKIEQKKPIKIWLAIGLAALLGAAFLIYKQKYRHPDNAKISELKRLINRSFPIAEPNLCPLSQEKTKVIKDENISMNINFISQLQNKTKTTLSSTRNPFLPPFEKGIMIAELPPKHRLLYNKFYFYKNHVLVVTQQYEDQTSRLSFEDLKQTLLVTLTINGVYFFNSGPESGYSQKHKHIQVLPSQAYKLPILSQIVKDIKDQNLQKLPYKSKQNIPIYLFKGYNFIHGIVLLPESLEQNNIEQSAIALKQAEDTLFTHLGLLLKNNKFSYNVIGTPKFLMMIPRKSEKTVGEIGVNSICFMGSMLVKDEKFFQQIDKLCKPTSILRDITFTQLPK